MDKKKLLFIFPRPPYPCIGGDKLRMYQNIIFLSKKYTIDIVFINEEKTIPETINELEKYARKVISFDVSKLSCYLNTFTGIFSKKPLQVHYYYHKKVKKWIDNNIGNYDKVFCTTIRTTEYVKAKNITKVIDFVDAISMNYQHAITKSSGIWKFMYMIDAKRLAAYEKEILPFFEKKVIISEIDKNFILKDINDSIEIIPNSVLINNFPKKVTEEFKITFIGKMDYEPNINAVVHFATKIFPLVLKQFPKLKFEIVGFRPVKKVLSLQKNTNIKVLGFVDDISIKIITSKLIIAPMVSGAGVQNKILQAMHLGKCVITTSKGAEGLTDVKNNSDIIITDNVVSFADNVVMMLKNDLKREKIGENAKNYIRNNFSEKMVANKLINYLTN